MKDDRKNIRVLLAEDEILSSECLKDVLRTCGYDVVGDAADGYEVLEMAASLHPDVVIMDIAMPRMDGLLATKKLQEVAPTPVVILSAHQSLQSIKQAREAGAGAYSLKPPDPWELDRSIQIAIQRHEDLMIQRELNDRLTEEIEARKKTEVRLEAALAEKTMLMKDLLHRTKNNMAAICGLLKLQSLQIKDNQLVNILKDAENTVRSMGMMHETLYRSNDFSKVDLQKYLYDVAYMVFGNYQVIYGKIKLAFDMASITVLSDTAIYCGLIVNELISNAIKYAFPDEQSGEIQIVLRDSGSTWAELVVRDNGIGLPEHFDVQYSNSLGLDLVTNFARGMNGDVLFVHADPGTEVVVRFDKQG